MINTETNTYTTSKDVFADYDPEIRVRTKKMMMWFIIFSIVMLFSGITSAMIVMYGKVMWVHIQPPATLWMSNVLVLVSSLTFYLAVKALKAGAQSRALGLTALTLLLGLSFVVTQNLSWDRISDQGMGYTITENEQGLKAYHWNTLSRIKSEYGKDFYIEWKGEKLVKEGGEFYAPSDPARQNPLTNKVMTTFNASGALISILIYVHIIHLAFGLIYLVVNLVRLYKNKLNQQRWISLYTGSMYWHFMGVLWLYLFAFVFFIY